GCRNIRKKKPHTTVINSASPEASLVIADAIVITGSEKEGDTARIITGSFHKSNQNNSITACSMYSVCSPVILKLN
ncbi:MAG: hypothetical protein ABIU11_02535, partial [Chitinophagaceae bacterium]